jgi:phosphoribosylformylglycinamidine (FGAM) synthase-like amidotransferase family enzyme
VVTTKKLTMTTTSADRSRLRAFLAARRARRAVQREAATIWQEVDGYVELGICVGCAVLSFALALAMFRLWPLEPVGV